MSDPSGACGQLARAGDDIMRERIEALAAELAEASKSSTSRHGRSEPIYSVIYSSTTLLPVALALAVALI